ncbi:peptidoglycan binding protein CsiV [Marinobacter hydrocarbonoclasticus]|nr:peptidoglycan binding protein CsiV [Marinobacter nauticus]
MKYLLPLLTVLTSIASPIAQAEDPTWFEVEVAVFTRPDASGEIWDQDQSPIALGNSRDLIGPVLMPDLSQFEAALSECNANEWLMDPQGCQERQDNRQIQMPAQLPAVAVAEKTGNPLEGEPFLLTRDQLQFSDTLAQLARKPGYSVLLHTGWQMPVYGRRSAQPFALYGGKNFAEQFQSNGHLKPLEDDLLSQFDFFTGFAPQSRQEGPLWQLNGKLKIYLDHFLFIEARLDLREEGERVWSVEAIESDPDALQADAAEVEQREPFLLTIPLDQNRRVRSREIHYFDHPKMGLVVQIRRMEQPQAAQPSEGETVTQTNP